MSPAAPRAPREAAASIVRPVTVGPVVCLHGLGRAPSDWDGVRPALAALGPVRAPDLPRARPDALLRARAAADSDAILVGHSMGAVLALRIAAEPGRTIRAVVLSGCFFPPARNGRGVVASLADYGRHRIAFVGELRGRPRVADAPGERRGTAGALRSLTSLAARPAGFDALAGAVRAPVLVVHARDDHHVPVDFALAAATGMGAARPRPRRPPRARGGTGGVAGRRRAVARGAAGYSARGATAARGGAPNGGGLTPVSVSSESFADSRRRAPSPLTSPGRSGATARRP
jgi:pimeloyl-ACP methyl ester carboxylesterase